MDDTRLLVHMVDRFRGVNTDIHQTAAKSPEEWDLGTVLGVAQYLRARGRWLEQGMAESEFAEPSIKTMTRHGAAALDSASWDLEDPGHDFAAWLRLYGVSIVPHPHRE